MATLDQASTSPRRAPRRPRRPAVGSLLLAAVAYIPLLFTAPGMVGADTKTYLYLDPSRLLARAPWMWDTHIGLGTVTHQNIGYLWPMGPWYWFFETIGLPDWVAQRLWLGTIIFAAGMGVRFMLREMRWVGPGLTVASFAYALSPYLLHYEARISVILLPFAGLPWLIGLASRSVHRGGWRWPAVFALVTLTVGGVNATSLLLVMAGPVLWMAHAVWISREASLRQVLIAGLRITLLTLVTSLWWIAGLAIQGGYGIPILRYTETYYTVANAALSTELLRGLGYWFFYGRDALGAWIGPAVTMTQAIPALALSFAIPGIALLAGFLTRFRNRGYFAILIAVGLFTAVGAHPWESSSPAGALFKLWTETPSGLAFRSTPRALPLIALGLAVMLAAAVAAVSNRLSAKRPVVAKGFAGALLLLVLANQWALFRGDFVDPNLQRAEEIPSYWIEATRSMDEGAHRTRVYALPGSDFASYRWGNTVDPIVPGLIDRPFVARELIPYGTAPSAGMLNAWDTPLQEGHFDPATLAPIARMLGIGTIAHRGDLQFERFRTPRPDIAYHLLANAPGLTEVATFGEHVGNLTTPELRLDDAVRLGIPPDWATAPAVSLFDVEDPRPITRTLSAGSPTIMAGDAAGIVAWAAIDALNPDRPILYSASFADDPEALQAQFARPDAGLVVTDTNRRRARRWGSVRENDGYTERAGEEPLEPDPTDNRLEVFPDAGDDARTVAVQRGDATVSASAYGNPVSYTPADRAVRAMDGNPRTAWRVGAFGEPRGEYLEVDLDEPVSTDSIAIQQSQRLGNRWMTEVELTFDGGDPMTVALDESSRGEAPGQAITFPERTFSNLRITVTETNIGVLNRYVGVSDVGIAEVTIPGVDPVVEVLRPPVDLLEVAGAQSIDHSLTWLFTRQAANPAEVVVSDEERVLRRVMDNPVARSYTLFGNVRAATDAPAALVDDMLGVTGARATADVRLAGDLRSRATSAIDGDPRTAWQTPVNAATGHTITVNSPEPFDVEGLDLTLRNDGLHSIPTSITVVADDGAPRTIAVSPIDIRDRGARNTTSTVTVPYEAKGVQELSVTIDAVTEANSIDWFGASTTVLPVGLVEMGLPVTAEVPPEDTALDTRCRDDLIQLDGRGLPVRVAGTVGEVLDGAPITFSGCEPVTLPERRSTITTTFGPGTGFDVDRLALSSAPGGAPGRNTLVKGPEPVDPGPETQVDRPGQLTWSVGVDGAEDPYWVVLGQSWSPGFTATVEGANGEEPVDLGEPTVVNGYANGWLVDPSQVGEDATITVTFAPQSMVWVALGASVVGILLCVGLILWPRRRREPGTDASRRPLPALVVSSLAPVASEGAVVSTRTTAITGVATLAVAWFLAGPAVGVVTAVVAVIALRLPRGQAVLRSVGVAAFAAAAGFVIAKQLRGDYVVDFNWVELFEVTHAWTLAAVLLLVADPVVSRLRRSGAERGPTADRGPAVEPTATSVGADRDADEKPRRPSSE